MNILPAPADPQLQHDLPPAPEPGDLPELEGLDEQPADDQEDGDELTPADVENIATHLDGLMGAAATLGATAFPENLQPQYIEQFTKNTYIRSGLRMTGIGEALNDLMPPAGKDSTGRMQSGPPAAVRKIHPLARVLLGVGVLAVGVVLQGRQFAAANGIQQAAPHPGGLGLGGRGGQRGARGKAGSDNGGDGGSRAG